MAYSATLANMRGILSDEEHKRILNLFSRAGLSMDHHQFDEDILEKGTKAILKTRDGLLRAAVPSPLGQCVFVNDVSMDDMYAALKKHKALMKNYPRNGEGLEAFVDSSDTGYTVNNKPVEEMNGNVSNGLKKLNVLNDDTQTNGAATNGYHNSDGKLTNGALKATQLASAEEKPVELANGATDVPSNGLAKGLANGVNGHSNGVHTNGVH
jgi:3-dehydroquinate synthase